MSDEPQGASRSTGESEDRYALRWAVWIPVVVVACAAVYWFGLRVGGLDGANAERLNVLLITVDTTRADYLGCYGKPGARTPGMDRLAREGTLFVRCSSCSPLTLPSHSSIMTSTYPYVHGARRNGGARLGERNLTLAEHLKNLGFTTHAVVATYVLHKSYGIAQGFDSYLDVSAPVRTANMIPAERKADRIGDDALKLLRSVAATRFFAWIHFFDPHHPYESSRIPDVESPEAYADEIAFMDVQIGRLMDELRRLGIERKTLVVLVGDHGEGLSEHQEWTHGYFLYDTTLRVPFIMRCPGLIPAGKRVNSLVRTIDIAPTILELVGKPPLPAAQGVSLLPLIRGEASDLELSAYAECLEPKYGLGLSILRSLTVGRWKYILAPRPELYDLDAQPDEQQDLIGQHEELADRMRARLRALLAEAPPAIADDDPVVPLGAAEIAALQSLGYVAGPGDDEDGAVPEIERFEPVGGDPKDYAKEFELTARAAGAISAGWNRQAETWLRSVVESLPEATQPRADLALALQRQGKFTESQALYEQVLAQVPQDISIRQLYAGLFIESERWGEALDQFGRILDESPDNTVALYNMGIALASLERMNEARQRFDQALEIEPDSPRILHAIGVLCVRQQQPREAARYFRQALQLAPDFKECRRDLRRIERAARP